MNKNRFLISVTLAAGLSWAGCSKGGKLDQASIITPPTGPVELKLKWPAGEHVVQSFDMKLTMELTLPNQPAPLQRGITLGQEYGLTVLPDTAGGGHEVELEFLSVRMKIDEGGKPVLDFNTAEKSSNPARNPTATAVQKMFQNVIGAKIQYSLDASNQVERLEGADALMNRLAANGHADALSGFKTMFNDGSLKQMINAGFLPPKPVQPGDSWPVQMDIVMGDLGTMVMDYTYTLAGWEKHGQRTCARLEFQGTIKTKRDAASAPAGLATAVRDGTSSGVSWFDPELGMVIDTSLNQDMNVTMTVPITARGKKTTQTITAVMKQAITVKLLSVK